MIQPLAILDKVVLRKLSQGIDFVGYVALPHYQLPRRQTVRRLWRKLARASPAEVAKTLPSYLGYLTHAATHRLRQSLLDNQQA